MDNCRAHGNVCSNPHPSSIRTHAHQSFPSSSIWLIQAWMTAFSGSAPPAPPPPYTTHSQWIFEAQSLDTKGLINSSMLFKLTALGMPCTLCCTCSSHMFQDCLAFWKLSLQTARTLKESLFNTYVRGNEHVQSSFSHVLADTDTQFRDYINHRYSLS